MTSPLNLRGVDLPVDIAIPSGQAIKTATTNPILLVDVDPDAVALRLGGSDATPDILVVPVPGPQGAQGLPGAAGGYDFVQASPSAAWVVAHNLGLKPSVTVVIGGAVALAEVDYDSVNQVTIRFARAQSGSAHLI